MPPTEKPIRAALYARVSTTGKGQDVELQLVELRTVAAQRGWVIAAEYIDDGVSGTKASRPALDRMMVDATKGKFDLVAVWKLDRLGRSLQNLLAVLDDLRRHDVGFVSLRDAGIDTTTPGGRLMLQMIGAFAEFERALIVERVKAGVAKAQASGKHCGRPRNDLDLRPAVALLREGHGLKEIARILRVSRTTIRRHLAAAGHWPEPRRPPAQIQTWPTP